MVQPQASSKPPVSREWDFPCYFVPDGCGSDAASRVARGWRTPALCASCTTRPRGHCPPAGCRAVLLSWGAGGRCSKAPTHLPDSTRRLVEAPAPHPGSPPRGPGAVSHGQEVSSHVCRVVWGRAAQGLHPGSRGQLAAGAGSLRRDTHPPRGCCLRWAQLGHLRAPPGDRELWGWAVVSRAHSESPLGGEDSLDVEVTGAPLAPTAGKAAQLGWPAGSPGHLDGGSFQESRERLQGGGRPGRAAADPRLYNPLPRVDPVSVLCHPRQSVEATHGALEDCARIRGTRALPDGRA